MKPIHVAATLVRLFSICMALYSLTLFLNVWIFYVSGDTPIVSLFSVSIPVAFLIISIVLWVFPISISRTITGLPSTHDDTELSFKSSEFLSMCMFALGIYFLYDIVGDSIYWLNYINGQRFADVPQAANYELKAGLWSLAAKAAFTGFLLAGNKRIVKLYFRLRHGG